MQQFAHNNVCINIECLRLIKRIYCNKQRIIVYVGIYLASLNEVRNYLSRHSCIYYDMSSCYFSPLLFLYFSFLSSPSFLFSLFSYLLPLKKYFFRYGEYKCKKFIFVLLRVAICKSLKKSIATRIPSVSIAHYR